MAAADGGRGGRSPVLGSLISDLRRSNCQLEMRLTSCRLIANNLLKIYDLLKDRGQELREENLALLQAAGQAGRLVEDPKVPGQPGAPAGPARAAGLAAANERISAALDVLMDLVGIKELEGSMLGQGAWDQPAAAAATPPQEPEPQLVAAPVSEAVPMPKFRINSSRSSSELAVDVDQAAPPSFAARLETAPEFKASAEDLFCSGFDAPQDIVAVDTGYGSSTPWMHGAYVQSFQL